MSSLPSLRPYQEALRDRIRCALREHRAVAAVAPTGAGKTIIFSSIARGALQRGHRVWILVHREEILHQTVTSLVSLGLSPGLIQSGAPLTSGPLQVAMVQTLRNRIELLSRRPPALVIIDECHHISPSYREVIHHIPEARVLGVTATPSRLDGRGIGEMYSCLVEGPSVADLVASGYLAPPLVLSSRMTQRVLEAKWAKTRGEYESRSATAIMSAKTIVNDTLTMYREHFGGAPAIIYGASVQDCRTIDEAMRGAGWHGGLVLSGMERARRRDLVEGLGTKYHYLLSYDVVSEGVDIPHVAGIITRRRTASLAVWLQQCGRALRPFPGKEKALIIDQVGNVFEHGHPLEVRAWSLAGAPGTRDRDDISVTQCPSCYVISAGRPSQCPHCGAVLRSAAPERPKKIHVIEAPLEEIRPQALRIPATQNTTSPPRESLPDPLISRRRWTDLVYRRFLRGGELMAAIERERTEYLEEACG